MSSSHLNCPVDTSHARSGSPSIIGASAPDKRSIMSSSGDATEDFATQLRVGTRTHHGVSGTLVKLSAPLALSSPEVYRLLLTSFYYIYKALEEQMETCRLQFPKIGVLYFRELLRTKAFERDLAHYYGLNFHNEIPSPSTATAIYIDDMRAAIAEEPVVLFAYCQALYMALFGGGKIIRGWVVRAFNLESDHGCAIFDFSDMIPDVDADAFRRLYADALNSVALSDAQKMRIIEQKKRVFEGNDTIIKEAIVKRPETWHSPQPKHIMQRIIELSERATRHSLPPWMCALIARLAEQGPDHIIREAIMVEPMSVHLLSDYDAARWRDSDMQPGTHVVATEESHSLALARFVVAAAVMVGCADYTDDRDYHMSETDTATPTTTTPTSVSAHVITPDCPPALLWRRDAMVVFHLTRLFALNLSARASRIVVAAARATLISSERTPWQYGNVRGLLASVYGPHAVAESCPRLAVAMAWLSYSAVRHNLLTVSDVSNQDHHVLHAVLAKFSLVSAEEREFVNRLAHSLEISMTTCSEDELEPDVGGSAVLPAGILVTSVDARRASFSSDTLDVPIVGWTEDSVSTRDTLGWFGPIKKTKDLQDAIDAIRDGRRPLWDMGETKRRKARFAISYKHERYSEGWRMSDLRTRGFLDLVDTVVSGLSATSDVYLWLDRVHEMDMKEIALDYDEDLIVRLRASTINVYCAVPVLFVEKDLQSDTRSLWLWVERLAGMCGQGCYGNWLPLIASTDGGISASVGQVRNIPGGELHYLKSNRHTNDVEERVADIILRSNINSKAVSDRRDFDQVVRWAEGYSTGDKDNGEFGTQQDWMGVHVGDDVAFSRMVMDRVNVVRCGRLVDKRRKLLKAECKLSCNGVMTRVVCDDGMTVFTDGVEEGEDGSVCVACVAPASNVLSHVSSELEWYDL